jgi:hypothetical protein
MSGEKIGSGPAAWRALAENGGADVCLEIELGGDFAVVLTVSRVDGPRVSLLRGFWQDCRDEHGFDQHKDPSSFADWLGQVATEQQTWPSREEWAKERILAAGIEIPLGRLSDYADPSEIGELQRALEALPAPTEEARELITKSFEAVRNDQVPFPFIWQADEGLAPPANAIHVVRQRVDAAIEAAEKAWVEAHRGQFDTDEQWRAELVRRAAYEQVFGRHRYRNPAVGAAQGHG